MYLATGTVLHDRYVVDNLLGHGGFGITYAALDKLLNVKVAIKEYLPRQLATRGEGQTKISVFTGEAREHYEYGLRKFLEEAQVLARFADHPNIVSARDFFEANGTAYMVMSFLEGVTLKDYLTQKGGRLPYQAALEIMVPVMDALREVHAVHLLHRDISPDNIFLTTAQQVKLIDFGAARYQAGEYSKSLSVILKVGYAPEEQYRSSGKQGCWTDVYAVAATFYRAITGQSPPDALDRLANDTLMAPSRLGVAIPWAAEQALLKALAVNAGQRFQTMGEFQQALLENAAVTMVQSAAAPSRSATAHPPAHPPAQATAQPLYPSHLPKRSILPYAISTGVIIAILLTGLIWWQAGSDSTSRDNIKPPNAVVKEQVVRQAPPALVQVPTPPPKETSPALPSVKSRFTINNDGVITDSDTGLEWYVGPDQDTTWHQAKAWIESLTPTRGAWRMPTVPELKTLYQPGAGSNNMDPIFQLTGYWVWAGQMKDDLTAWGFSFKAGRGQWDFPENAANGRVLAVRSQGDSASRWSKPAETRFTKSQDGVIFDNVLDLEWYLGPNQNTNWHQAKAWTEKLTAAGGGWRLPTVQELEALYQKGAGPNNIPPIFPTIGTWVWFGQMRDDLSAWCYSFRYGKKHWWVLDFAYNGRALGVRSSRRGWGSRVSLGKLQGSNEESRDGYSDNWVYVGSCEGCTQYYNSSSILHDTKKKIIKVWVKEVYTDKYIKSTLNNIENNNRNKYIGLKYGLILKLLDYKNMKCYDIRFIWYDQSDDMLLNQEYPPKWKDIIPDTMNDTLIKLILITGTIKR